MKKLYTIKQFAEKNKALGCWPDTESAIRGIRYKNYSGVFNDAFITLYGRVLIDEEKFYEILESYKGK